MSTMTMTMIGMYNVDQTLFDNMILPDELDHDLVINAILMRSGEFEVLYPDIDFMKLSIGVWSRKWSKTFSDWVKGQQATWNPIENYDRYEDFTDSGSKSGSSTSSGTSSGSDTFGGTGSNTNSVSAYDASTFQPSAKTDTTTSNSSTSSSTTSASSTDSETSSNTHTGHIHGNIGVTQASEMLKSFYDISAWNIYEHIADVFVTEYCIPIY